MKSFLLLLVLVATACASDPVLPPKITDPPSLIKNEISEIPDSVSFGFWNIRWFPGHHPVKQDEESRKEQINAVNGFIHKWDPTVLFACEIRDLDHWQKIKPRYPYLACTDIVRLESENAELPQQGIAIMSRIPWEKIWTLDFSELPDTPDRPSRGMLGVQFKLPDGKILTCYAFHLKSNRGGISETLVRRQRAVNYLEWDWERLGLDPKKDAILLLGDFNTSAQDPTFKEDRTIAMLQELGFHHSAEGLPREERLTIPASRYPANDFDHIMISDAAKQLLEGEPEVKQEARDVPREVSDHSAVFLDVTRLFEK
ncbi:MAG: endonuclease/exonuclease/phosphatase family protein [Verrucomicrobiota bacterium]